jgi:hypothetical protein
MLGIWTIFGLSLVLSTWNAWSAGAAWDESKAVGGLRYFLIWIVALVSVYGFFAVYGALAVVILHHYKLVAEPQILALTSWWAKLLVPQLVVAVVTLMIRSWAEGFRNGGFIDYGDSVYDVWVPINNSRSVSPSGGGGALPDIAKSAGSASQGVDFDSGNAGGGDLFVGSAGGGDIGFDVDLPDDPKALGGVAILAIGTCVLSIAGVTTWLIIRHVSRRVQTSQRLPRSYEQARRWYGKSA